MNLAPRILVRDFDPGFYVEHFVKDLGIVLNECEKMNCNISNETKCPICRKIYINAFKIFT